MIHFSSFCLQVRWSFFRIVSYCIVKGGVGERDLDKFLFPPYLHIFCKYKVRCSGLLGRTFDAKFKQTAAKLFSAEFLLKPALLQNGMFNLQQFINHVLFDIYWQNMKFNIQKYIGDVLSGV